MLKRVVAGNAKIAGLSTDLKLSGLQYNTAVTMFFVSYGFFEVPSNIVLKIMRPSRWIAILMYVHHPTPQAPLPPTPPALTMHPC